MDDSVFLSKMRDVVRLCDKYHAARFSRFLDMREQAVLENSDVSGTFFGGYDGAERKIFGAFPDWQEPDFSVFPIAILKITLKGGADISHRQYLGTILSLGIERDRIGDILTEQTGAYVFLSADISEYVQENITKIGRCGAYVKFADLSEVSLPDRKFKEISCVCASLRLDAAVSALMNISRNEAKSLIMAGKACVNHFDMQKTDFVLKEGDLLSIRGFGRAEVGEIGAKTRSDRIHIMFKKYI